MAAKQGCIISDTLVTLASTDLSVLTSLMTALSSLGLVTDSTT